MLDSTNPEITVYVGLGSNLENPIQQVQTALLALGKIPKTKLISHSSLYQSKPMGPADQGDYINSVAELSTSLSSLTLLDELQDIENTQGRVRKSEQWSARTLDLDLLLYANQIISTPRLIVPHYGMKDRLFVLLPLIEIAPTLRLPDNSQLSNLVNNLTTSQSSQEIHKL
ncbi:MAG: 2-amino-4-hydroxy-6-hydroxymethyldihydropteridine diphosphokinase [Kangiellaceae bacterium]|nr:2-amino-4-hydroxy-6-hydroxymethyldihydropteridine diphosphokinase [Kangiellaceae bacterium]